MIDPTNRNTALASALVEELARMGCNRAVLSPGSRSTPIALALDREPGIELTVVLDERSAGFTALGMSMTSETPTLIACTSGSAAANLHPAVVEADQAGVPLIVLTSDRPPELRGIGAGQTIDQIGLYGEATRWFCEVGTHEADDVGLLHMRATGCRAFAEARDGRGPVQLNLSWRDPLGPEPEPDAVSAGDALALEGRSGARPLTVPISPREPTAELIESLAEAVARAERPLIVVGRGPSPVAVPAIARLAEAAAAPVLADVTSQLRFGSPLAASPLLIGFYDLITRSPPRSLESDLILRFGDMPTSKPLRAWVEATGADQIVIDPPGRWNEPSRRAGAFVRVEAAAAAERIASALEGAADASWSASWSAAESAAREAVDSEVGSGPELSEPAVHQTLAECFEEGDNLLLASSMPIRDAETFMRGGSDRVRVFSNRGANGIDGTVSTAAGIARASGAPTWIVLGDLALAYDLGGLASLPPADEAPMRIVVLDNGGGGIFDFLPQASQVEPDRFRRLFTTPAALDHAKVAALFDLDYVEIEGLSELGALRGERNVLARVPIERAGNVALHQRIAEHVAAALT